MRSVFGYRDYRLFLKEYYAARKASDAGFSYRRFSESAGLESPNYLALVINGKRNLTVSNIHQFARALSLRFDEREYFESLVLWNQAKNTREAFYYRQRAAKQRKAKPASSIKRAPGTAIRLWYHPAVMVYAHGKTRAQTVAGLVQQLPLPLPALENCLAELLKLGLLTEEDGALKICAQQTTFHDPKSHSLHQQLFLEGQLELSRRAFIKAYAAKTDAKFLSHTLTVPEGSIALLQQRFTALVEDLTAEMDQAITPGAEQLAQINVQVFHPRALH